MPKNLITLHTSKLAARTIGSFIFIILLSHLYAYYIHETCTMLSENPTLHIPIARLIQCCCVKKLKITGTYFLKAPRMCVVLLKLPDTSIKPVHLWNSPPSLKTHKISAIKWHAKLWVPHYTHYCADLMQLYSLNCGAYSLLQEQPSYKLLDFWCTLYYYLKCSSLLRYL